MCSPVHAPVVMLYEAVIGGHGAADLEVGPLGVLFWQSAPPAHAPIIGGLEAADLEVSPLGVLFWQ